jgi:hypothetical protein
MMTERPTPGEIQLLLLLLSLLLQGSRFSCQLPVLAA